MVSPALLVEAPGVLTTVQDLGRPGWQAQGVTPGGALDRQALRIGNLLLGNREDAAALECTYAGPRVRFTRASWICLAGAPAGGHPMWRPFRVEAGEPFDVGALTGGARVHLCVAGGIAVGPVLGSRSTHLAAGFGGVDGRALREGDVLPLGETAFFPDPVRTWTVSPSLLPPYRSDPVVRVFPGPQWRDFSAAAREAFLNSDYEVSAQSDRMGLRLEGPSLPLPPERGEMFSAPVTNGSIQVPPDGRPIVLLADRQTLGGYPRIAGVAAVDLPLLAQVRPGARVRFVRVSRGEAEQLWAENERRLALLRAGMQLRRTRA